MLTIINHGNPIKSLPKIIFFGMGHDSNGFTDAMMPWSTYHVAPLGHDAQDAMMGSILDMITACRNGKKDVAMNILSPFSKAKSAEIESSVWLYSKKYVETHKIQKSTVQQ